MDVQPLAMGGQGQGFGAARYRGYVLGMLTLVYTLSSIDRLLIGVLAQPIIEDFRLQDWQFGLLSGFGFIFMYSVAGIPIARLAERYNRVRIIAVCLAVWSVMTMLCGFAWGFVSLLLCRVGVGIGEAGCLPPCNSLIGDYYPARSRAKALAIFGLGVALGGVGANTLGSPIAQVWGWREAFIALGAPGLVVAAILWVTVREPPRGYSDMPGVRSNGVDSLLVTLRNLAGKRTFWWVTGASLLSSLVGGATANFQGPLFQRLHELTVAQVSFTFILPMALAAALGSFATGWLTERWADRYPNAVAWLPGFAILAATPFYFTSMSADALWVAAPAHAIAACLHYSFLGSQYSIVQGIVKATSRATAVAVYLLANNLLGSGLGPLIAGYLSDFFGGQLIAASELAGQLAIVDCKGTAADLLARLGPDTAEFCRVVTRDGLQRSLLVFAVICVPTGVGFLLVSRTLQKDLVSRMA